MNLRYALARLRFARARAKEEGLWWTARQLVARGAWVPLWLLLAPFAVLAHLAGYRRLSVVTERIGHLAAEIDCFLKLRALGELPELRWFVLAPAKRVANAALLDCWRPHVRFVTNPLACTLIGAATRWGPARHDITDYVLTIDGAARYGRVNATWGGRPPLLSLSEADRERGEAALRSLGVPQGAWYVCVHARGPGFSSADERVHAHRNSDVANLLPAIDRIIARGGWCIRMGDPSMPRLPPRVGLVDYAHHPLRSAFLDVFLCASCRFFLGSSSGLFLVATIFGRPSALANMVPLSTLGFAPGDLSIPKLFYSRKESRLLRFAEVLASELANARIASAYRDAGIDLLENSPQDIAALAMEMLDQLEGTGGEREREFAPLQDAFARLLGPRDFGYGSAARVAGSFLAAHRELL